MMLPFSFSSRMFRWLGDNVGLDSVPGMGFLPSYFILLVRHRANHLNF
jgi:hypothetical protein